MSVCGPSDKLPNSRTSISRPFSSVLVDGTKQIDALALGEGSTFRREPALRISRREIEQLSVPFQNSLVGRFSFSIPPMEVIRKFFLSLDLRGDYKVGLLDQKYVLIHSVLEENYTRLFARRIWYVSSSPMSISKWSLEFKAD